MTGNSINLVGIILLFIAHSTLSLSDKHDRLAYAISGLGAVTVGVGSYLLNSYPIVWLNIFWASLSFYRAIVGGREFSWFGRALGRDGFTGQVKKLPLQWMVGIIMLVTGVFSLAFGHDDLAYLGSGLYVISYFALTTHLINKLSYLVAGLIGYAMIVPHLVDVHSWAVLGNETLGATIAALGVARLMWANVSLRKVA